jgi:prepilin-type N-terminal cleavage/methylation domain-containing protein
MNKRGFTLIEVLFAVSLLTVVMGTLYGVSLAIKRGTDAQEAQMAAGNEAVKAIEFIARDLTQAAQGTITGTMPGPAISYQVAADLDGNGVALDKSGKLELSPPHRLGRDAEDVNHDGFGPNQLVLITDKGAQVLATGLVADEDANGNGSLDPGEDKNGNGVLDRGIWFEQAGKGYWVHVATERKAQQGHVYGARLSRFISPRN